MVPRRFFWLFDLFILSAAFLTAYRLTPTTVKAFAPGGFLYAPWIQEVFTPYPWTGELPPLTDYLWVSVVTAPVALVAMGMLSGYKPLLYQSRVRIVVSSFAAPMIGLSVVALILYALKNPEWSRIFIFSFGLLAAVGLCLYRLGLRRYFAFRRAAGYYARNVLVIGLPAVIEWMARYFSKHVSATDYRLLGYLGACSDQPAISSPPDGKDTSTQVRFLGGAEKLGDLLIHRPIHEVIAVLPTSGGEWLTRVIQDCDFFRVTLRIVPQALLVDELRDLHAAYRFGPLHLPAIALMPPHFDQDALFFKRLFDIAVSATLLVLLLPLFGLVAIAIKITTPNLPILYHWRVVGQNGVPFTGYKFTTMVVDADDRKAALMSQNEMNGPVFKIKHDPRVTVLGHVLRKYSINELPQLWSVLKADMSLVGPRPAGPHELERYEFWHKRKLCIRPGITCLWQVRGRNKISNFDDWVRMDLEYIDNWSLWLDFKILVRTAFVVLAGTGS